MLKGKQGRKKRGNADESEDFQGRSNVVFQDTFAILMAAYHPGIDLLGISTVYGNTSVQ